MNLSLHDEMTSMNRKRLAISVLALFMTFVFTLAPANSREGKTIESINGIAAIVNKTVITKLQVNQAVKNVKKHLLEQNVLIPDEAQLHKQVLNQLIMEELQLQMAKQAKITVTPKELRKAIYDIATRNHLSVTELKAQVEAQGQSYPAFEKEIEKQMLISKVQHAAVGNKIKVTDEQVQAYLRKNQKQHTKTRDYHLADILVEIPDNATPTQVANAKNRAEDIYKKLQQGESFEKVAKLESSADNALEGGDMGWKNQHELPDLFVDQIKLIKVGQITEPLKADNGFHILKLLGVKQGGSSLTQAQAEQSLMEQQFQKAVNAWLKTLKQTAYIQIF